MQSLGFIGQAQATTAGDPGIMPPWWQILGAFLLVIALLIVFLKLLNRMQTGAGTRDTRILETHNVGPGRSVEVLRYRGRVYSIYRHDSAGVLLETESAETFEPQAARGARSAFNASPWLKQLLGRGKGPSGS